MDTEPYCNTQDDIIHIAEYMKYYEFEFDSTQDNTQQSLVDNIPLSDTLDSAHLVSISTPVLPPPILII